MSTDREQLQALGAAGQAVPSRGIPREEVVALIKSLPLEERAERAPFQWAHLCCGANAEEGHADECPLVAFCARHGIALSEVE